MNAIWKVILKITDVQDIEVPEGAEFLTAREQNEQLCVWFKCEPSMPKTTRRIILVGTGNTFDRGKYIGTGILLGGEFVIHVFER